MIDEEKYSKMAEKLADQSKKQYNDKKQHELIVKQTADMAKSKVQELEDELDSRQKHFDSELMKMESENKMLKELLEGK